MDRLTSARRSRLMAAVRGKDTTPELAVRRTVHQMGYRYRLHDCRLPGKPDLVFPRLRAVIFVHGCFWHQHPGCREGRPPSSNVEYWGPKLQRNVDRDLQNIEELARRGWQSLVVWECETSDETALKERIREFLS